MRKIQYQELLDRIHGGWIGKALGGSVGRFEGTKRITEFKVMELMPDGMQPNDDLDIQLIWLDVLLDKGVYFTGDDLMRAWIDGYDYNFGEYSYGRRNFLRGIHPPYCGDYANIFYKTGMGCPIRSEVWGMIAPGTPDVAAAYARVDGELDHAGESVWAEQMLSAMEAEAFFTQDLRGLLDCGLRYLPDNSLTRRCVEHAVALHGSGIRWQDAWQQLMAEHSHPDCTYTPFNLGIIAMALLYGGGDMEDTLAIAVNAGWDVDCTCSTTAALLGILAGGRKLLEKWGTYLSDEVITMARPKHDLSSLVGISEITARAAVTLLREGRLGIGIDGIPDGLAPLKAAPPKTIQMHADYDGFPAAAMGETKRVSVTLCSDGDEDTTADLHIKGPEGALVPAPESVCLPAHGVVKKTVEIRLPSGSTLNDKNLFVARFAGCERSFGIAGAPDAKVLGPYFDSYEQWCALEGGGQMLETSSYSICTPLFGEEWGNHRVDIDKPYIDEEFVGSALRQRFDCGRKVAIYEDSYRTERVFGLRGPCVCYWYQELVSPIEQDVQFFIGSSDPAKLWLNGELVFTQRGNRFYYCNNDVVDVHLKRGVNTLVLKTARMGADQMLTLCVREVPKLMGYDSCPFVMGLAWSTL